MPAYRVKFQRRTLFLSPDNVNDPDASKQRSAETIEAMGYVRTKDVVVFETADGHTMTRYGVANVTELSA